MAKIAEENCRGWAKTLPEQRRRVFPAQGEHPAAGEGQAAPQDAASDPSPARPPVQAPAPSTRGFPLPKPEDFMEDDAFVSYVPLAEGHNTET